MKTYNSRNFIRYPNVVLILLSLLLLTSCGSKGEINDAEYQSKETPPANFIGFGTMERTIRKNVYLNNENVGNLKESEVLTKVRAYAAGIDTQASNATMDNTTWKVKQGRIGKKVNVEKTMEALLNAPEGNKVDLIVDEELPLVTSQILIENIVTIGSYTTSILDKDESRVNNIELASERIDGLKLSPGEQFSFNKIVGRRTEEKGYEKATIITRKDGMPKKGTGVGGGICQVSSTLYNAIDQCGLKIIERHKHSKAVGYVPKGKDATVTYGAYDFRFSNNRSYPIMIRTYLNSNTLTVKILENRNS
ncbi:VanW family protein [Pseudobacteroides cellulosolvens]|uniref:VanW family protein n=1 Tax=Pseudobacteroides cellulosolvens ATCC 35603 = DSM 2933 TaxID=398512 RepID=A0A0L6JIW1_9FIRM|nr:VanW family protein [Pseudobacteroides cellulosolvens]KNY25786.1 VanW family protein [Pseudobacteroides cellulosolvens ATCC 35603 = DSM 2933]